MGVVIAPESLSRRDHNNFCVQEKNEDPSRKERRKLKGEEGEEEGRRTCREVKG